MSSLKAKAQVLLAHDGRASLLFEHLGALTWAEKLDRLQHGGDVSHISLPIGSGQLRAHRIRMYGENGRDIPVRGFVERGWRGFEYPLPEVFVRTVRAVGGAVYDVGANSGLYSLLAVEADSAPKVTAFEPYPPVLELLHRNIRLSRGARRIRVVEAAASDTVGISTLFVPRDSGVVETSASLDGAFKEDIADEIEVPTITLDHAWVTDGRPDVGVVKIDTEGTEHRVLAGAVDLVLQCRPIVFFEVLPRASFEELTAFADKCDLLDVRLSSTGVSFSKQVEFDPDAWNHAFVPAEDRDRFESVLAESGLRVPSNP